MTEQKPWSDVQLSDDEIELAEAMAGRGVFTYDEAIEAQKQERWKDDATLEERLERNDRVDRVERDTPRDHNVHIYTTFTAMPADIVLEDGFDAAIDWPLLDFDLKSAGWRRTNERLVDGQLVLTLAPDGGIVD